MLRTSHQRANFIKGEIREKISTMLATITGNPKARMAYEHYMDDIVLKYGVELVGWDFKMANPSELSSALGPLQEQRRKIENRECKFIKLSSEELRRKQADYDAEIAGGKRAPRVRKMRKDAGEKRKKGRSADVVEDEEEDSEEEPEEVVIPPPSKRRRQQAIVDDDDHEMIFSTVDSSPTSTAVSCSTSTAITPDSIDSPPVQTSATASYATPTTTHPPAASTSVTAADTTSTTATSALLLTASTGSTTMAGASDSTGANSNTPNAPIQPSETAGALQDITNTEGRGKRARKPAIKSHLGYVSEAEQERERKRKADEQRKRREAQERREENRRRAEPAYVELP